MDEDPEVADTLRRSSFLLPRRLEFIRDSTKRYAARQRDFRIVCAACGIGQLALDEASFVALRPVL
jgi:hypothetical protein